MTGLIAIFFALFGLQKRTWLLAAVILSAPFSAMAVMNFPEHEKALTFPVFFSAIYVVVSLLQVNMVKRAILDRRFWLAGFFVLALLASMVFSPAWMSAPEGFLVPPKLSQLAYVLLGVLTAFFIAQDVRYNRLGADASRYVAYAAFLICVIGLLQLGYYFSGADYPAWIFNNSVNPTDQGYTAILGDGLKRISSASSEPSILALFLSGALAFLIFRRSKIVDSSRMFVIVTCVLVLMLSTSATAYMGLGLIFFLYPFAKVNNWRDRMLVAYFFLGLALLAIYFLWPLIQTKLGSYSALERFRSVVEGWIIFMHYPVLGRGWGTVTVNSLPFSLLANVGFVGFLSFALWVLLVLYESSVALRLRVNRASVQGYLAAFVVLISLQAVTGFAYVYSFFWIFFGLLMGHVYTVRQPGHDDGVSPSAA